MDMADCLSPGHLVINVWPGFSSILELQERKNNTIPKRAILFFIIYNVDLRFEAIMFFTFFIEANDLVHAAVAEEKFPLRRTTYTLFFDKIAKSPIT